MNELKWLNKAIAEGLMGLVALRLPGTPPEEVIKRTAKIWVLALTKGSAKGWDETQDAERIRHAFVQLYADSEFFPSPKMLIDRLPKRKQPEVMMLEKQVTPQERQRNLEHCRKLKAMLTEMKGLTHVRKQ